MIGVLLLMPLGGAFGALVAPGVLPARIILLLAAGAHAVLTATAWIRPVPPALDGWLALDAPGLIFLTLASGLFLAATVTAPGYLAHERPGPRRDFLVGVPFVNEPERVFIACLLIFLSSMTFVCVAHRFGLLWVAIEATTLASAPLIYFHRQPRALEATWKYLMVCSVGIAIALLGTFFLACAAKGADGVVIPLTVEALGANASRLDPRWLRAAFLLCLVGYGTKMGLAPMHTWLPDAHSEAPSLVSALLSGALLNCSFLGILRLHVIVDAAGQGAVSRGMLLLLGAASLVVAATFILRQPDFKRMLAYSSVEHVGLLALGAGVGGRGTAAALLHAVNHTLVKGALFLVAGNLLTGFGTKAVAGVTGASRRMPWSGGLWLAGMLAISGMPPFGPFVSELMLIRTMVDAGRFWLAAGVLAALGIIFMGMIGSAIRMSYGAAPSGEAVREAPWFVLPPLLLLGLALVLGLYLPEALRDRLAQAAQALGATP